MSVVAGAEGGTDDEWSNDVDVWAHVAAKGRRRTATLLITGDMTPGKICRHKPDFIHHYTPFCSAACTCHRRPGSAFFRSLENVAHAAAEAELLRCSMATVQKSNATLYSQTR